MGEFNFTFFPFDLYRTARGNRKGTALSFVEITDRKDFEDVKEFMLKSKSKLYSSLSVFDICK